jgi:hypothetical protein
VLKKATRSKDADVPDVPADDPVGTMDRFREGLKKVLMKKPEERRATSAKRRRSKRPRP